MPAPFSAKGNRCVDLVVVAGAQEGAVAELSDSDVVSIGSSPDCDVILLGGGVAEQHLTLQRDTNGALVEVTAVSGPVTVKDLGELAPGFCASVPLPLELEFGDCAVGLSAEVSAPVREFFSKIVDAPTRLTAGHRTAMRVGLIFVILLAGLTAITSQLAPNGEETLVPLTARATIEGGDATNSGAASTTHHTAGISPLAISMDALLSQRGMQRQPELPFTLPQEPQSDDGPATLYGTTEPEVTALPIDEMRLRLEERLNELGFSGITVAVEDDEVLIVDGTITPDQSRLWDETLGWVDRSFPASLRVIGNVGIQDADIRPDLPMIESVWVHGDTAFVTIAGERYSVGSTMPNGWTLTRITKVNAQFFANGDTVAINF